MTLLLIGLGLFCAVSVGRTVHALRQAPPGEERGELWTTLSIMTAVGILVSVMIAGNLGAPFVVRMAVLASALPLIGVGGLRARRQLAARRRKLLQRTVSATTHFDRLDALEARRSLDGGLRLRRQLLPLAWLAFLVGLMGVSVFQFPARVLTPFFYVLLVAMLLLVVLSSLKLRRDVIEHRLLDREIESARRAIATDRKPWLEDEA